MSCLDDKRPLPVSTLLFARHDTIHRDPGAARAARSVKVSDNDSTTASVSIDPKAAVVIEIHEWRNRDGSWPRSGQSRITTVFAEHGDRCVRVYGESPVPGEHRLLTKFSVSAKELDTMLALLPRIVS